MTAATDTLPPRRASERANVAQNLITVRDLRIAFDQNRYDLEVVKGVSFRIPPAKTVALVGESGAGKSVIGQAIMGILPTSARITGGEILFADPEAAEVKDLARIDPASKQYQSIRGGRISVIFQEPMTSLSAFHTIGDQISEALFLHRDVSRREGLDLVVEMLDLCGFPNPSEAVKRYPFELSGGLRQRAMIAMALVCDPALLIADEPTTALDVSVQAQILKLIKELQARLDMAVLIITHDLGVVANMADEVVVLFHGEVMESGTVKDIYSTPEHPYLNGLFGAVPHFDMKPGERLISPADLSPKPDAKPAKKTKPAKRKVKGGQLLDVRNLTKEFVTRKSGWLASSGENTIVAVDDVSFEIRQRECLGLVGESGCGKSTLSKLIMRALAPTSGEILYNHDSRSIDLAQHREHGGELNRAIQMVFQDPFGSLNPRMTVFDIIREPLVIHEIGERADHAAKVQELMRLVRLDPRFLNRYPHSFSGGQRQRIGLARALALDPTLLILDEPVSALDVSIQAQILNLLKDMQAELGLTYLFVSHNLAVVDYVADRIIVMCRGRIVESAPREVLFRNPVHHYTRALMAAVPYADINRPLDFGSLTAGDGMNPALWPSPFTFQPGEKMEFLDLGDEHKVLVTRGATRKELPK
ncbi:MAG: ABC transporter ATP-binding protein [Hyphomicrobiales bacterium]|nr:ABC transporter ATP-binding protein [Hyphomicrobiales bacterium]